MSSHGSAPPSSTTLKLCPMSLVPNIVYWQFTARSAVDAQERRVALPGDETRGAHHPGVDFESRTRKPETFGRREGHRLRPGPVNQGKLALVASVRPAYEDLRGRHRVTRREGQQAAVGGRGESVQRPIAADDPCRRFAAPGRDPPEA